MKLVDFIDEIQQSMNSRQQTDLLFIGFSKAFDTVQWRIQDGAFGPPMLLIKTVSKFYVRPTEISLKLMKICTFTSIYYKFT